jgi:hypothetical protein
MVVANSNFHRFFPSQANITLSSRRWYKYRAARYHRNSTDFNFQPSMINNLPTLTTAQMSA